MRLPLPAPLVLLWTTLLCAVLTTPVLAQDSNLVKKDLVFLREYSHGKQLPGDSLISIVEYDKQGHATHIYLRKNGLSTNGVDSISPYTHRRVGDTNTEDIEYSYNPDGRVVQELHHWGRTVSRTEYLRDLRGHIREQRYFSNLHPDGKTVYRYDAADSVIAMHHLLASGAQWGYDSLVYDAKHRLVQRIAVGYGRPLVTTYSYDPSDRLSHVSYGDTAVIYAYTKSGCIVSRHWKNGSVNEFYDAEKRLTETTSFNGKRAVRHEKFIYNRFGQLVRRETRDGFRVLVFAEDHVLSYY